MKIHIQFKNLLLLACSAAAFAQNTSPTNAELDKAIDSNVGDHIQFHQVFTQLQQAVAGHNVSAVAALVDYPLAIKFNGKTVLLRTPQSFMANYDRILTPEITSAIEKQKYDDLMVNYQGAMFGNGQVWIAGICRDKACKQSDIKIRTIQSTADIK